MITFSNVNCTRNHRLILNNLSFACALGETTVLLGGSGSGKSSILKLMLGLLAPESGTINFKDKNLKDWDLLELRRQAGYVIQNGGLFPHMTMLQNITLMANFLKKDRAWIRSRVVDLLELVNLKETQLEKLPYELSGGENQRVALMRALFLDPKVLFFDEPLSALDPITRSDLQKDLKQIFGKLKKTVVLVTHDLFEASYLGDRLILLQDGVIKQNSSSEEFLKNPKTEYAKKFVNAQTQGRIML